MPTQEMVAYYARFASAGVGLIVTEALYVDDKFSQTYLGQPGLRTEAQQAAWSSVVDRVHAEGTAIFAQLQHGGAFREPGLGGAIAPVDYTPAGPSWQQGLPHFTARAATVPELDEIRESFGHAAVLAREAGFDGVELHGARGYLLDAFTSGGNTRADGFGGPLTNRLRFATSVVETVKRSAPELILGYNLSLYKMDARDYSPPGGVAETREIVRALEDAGVDVFHVSTRSVNRCAVEGELLVDLVRASARRPLIAGGGVKSLDEAEAMVRDGRADMISLARTLVANPDMIDMYRRGERLQPYQRGMERVLAS